MGVLGSRLLLRAERQARKKLGLTRRLRDLNRFDVDGLASLRDRELPDDISRPPNSVRTGQGYGGANVGGSVPSSVSPLAMI